MGRKPRSLVKVTKSPHKPGPVRTKGGTEDWLEVCTVKEDLAKLLGLLKLNSILEWSALLDSSLLS